MLSLAHSHPGANPAGHLGQLGHLKGAQAGLPRPLSSAALLAGALLASALGLLAVSDAATRLLDPRAQN
jgi:hypothetical protein